MTATARSDRLPDDFRRILVICTRQIGDVLLTTPLIRATRERWPGATIDVLGFAGTLGMLQGNPDIAKLIEVPPGSGWRASLGLIARLWRQYDLALVAQHTDRAHLYGFVAARVRSGQVPDEPRAWLKRALLRHAVVLGEGHSHVVIEKLRLLAPWLGPAEQATVEVVAPPARPLPPGLVSRIEPPYAVLHVPSLVHYKQWPLANYAALGAALAADGLQIVLSGGPSGADRAAVGRVAERLAGQRVLPVAGELDFNQLAGLLSAAALYVGPDTSVTHLAAACGVPVVALFGPIDPRLWGPWSGRLPPIVPYERRALRQHSGSVSLLQGTPACVPCNRAGCENHVGSRSDCLETMSPERVIEEARARLAQARSAQSALSRLSPSAPAPVR